MKSKLLEAIDQFESLDDLRKAVVESDEDEDKDKDEDKDEDDADEDEDEEDEDEDEDDEDATMKSLVGRLTEDDRSAKVIDATPFLATLIKGVSESLQRNDKAQQRNDERWARVEKALELLPEIGELAKSLRSDLDDLSKQPAPLAQQRMRVLKKGGADAATALGLPYDPQAFKKSLNALAETDMAAEIMILGSKYEQAMTRGDTATMAECMNEAPVKVIEMTKSLSLQ